MRAVSEEGVDPLVATSVQVGNAEDVGGCVSCCGIAEEDGSARGYRARAVCRDERWRLRGKPGGVALDEADPGVVSKESVRRQEPRMVAYEFATSGSWVDV